MEFKLGELVKNNNYENFEDKKIIITPHKGISIVEEGDIHLGDSKERVISLLGDGESFQNEYYYYNSSLLINFDKNNLVDYIECNEDKKVKAFIYGKNLFSSEEDEIIELLSKRNKAGAEKEGKYIYYFLNLDLSIGKEFTLEDILDISNEMKKDGTYEKHKEEIKKDKNKAKYFTTIGIGVKDYYK